MGQRSTSVFGRRTVLKGLAALGAGTTFSRALATLAEDGVAINTAMIRQAEWIAGVEYSAADRELLLRGIRELNEDFRTLRLVPIDNGVPPALVFRPAQGSQDSNPARPARARATSSPELPADPADIAFASVPQLGHWLRSGQISAVELTRLYIERLQRHDEVLECVISLTPELALRQAERADRELAAGNPRGPLHGIPWGAKDLLAVPGYRTTWGAKPYQDQVREGTATVAAKLERAGAVLIAKLTLGALAWGDVWYGGTTKNPWDVEQGSSGSSAGSSSATAAGLVGFSIGSETWGSIVSPCTRCGATGLRPTFGAVSRHGAMALSWSMDKLGPIARSVEDCALVFDAIRGRDDLDPSVVEQPFVWPLERELRELKVGYIEEMFERDRTEGIEDETVKTTMREWQEFDRRSLATLREMGLQLVPFELPSDLPVDSLSFILTAEAATAFDDLTRSGRDDELVRQVDQAWPNVFRQGQLIPAVEYLRANRIRSRLIAEMERAMSKVDLYVCPSFGGSNLLLTNLTGHPCVVLPNGFASATRTPTSITFNGRLHGEAELLAVADAYQRETGYHLERPPLGA